MIFIYVTTIIFAISFNLVWSASSNPCMPYPCTYGGYCKPVGDHHECVCEPGFYGKRCEYVDMCYWDHGDQICHQGGATCQPDGSLNYTCNCPDGLKWDDQVKTCVQQKSAEAADPCAPHPCFVYGGECQVVTPDQYQCNCFEGFFGDLCQYQDMCYWGGGDQMCHQGGATCQPTQEFYKCVCPDGQKWDDLLVKCVHTQDSASSWNMCKPSCSYTGICTLVEGEYKCVCQEGFHGERCTYADQCYYSHGDQECRQGGATCQPIGSLNYTCNCPHGQTWDDLVKKCVQVKSGKFEDNYCLEDVYYGLLGNEVCANENAECKPVPGWYTCLCKNGLKWDEYRRICTEDIVAPPPDPCNPDPCSYSGWCEALLNDKYQCHCNEGYIGDKCQHMDMCHWGNGDKVCNQGGATCHPTDNFYHCKCPDDDVEEWDNQLEKCVRRKDAPDTCKVEENGSSGYEVCSKGDAKCVPWKHSYYCQCLQHGHEWNEHTKKCLYKATSCDSHPCQNGGQCIPDKDSFLCTCTQEYFGEVCQHHNHCHVTSSANGKQVCQTAGAKCRPLVGDFTCDCLEEGIAWNGTHCHKIPTGQPCSANPCANGATCEPIGEKDSVCRCPNNRYGHKCDMENFCYLDIWYGFIGYDVCKWGGAKCEPVPGWYRCECDEDGKAWNEGARECV